MILCGTCAWSDHQHFYPKSVRAGDKLAYYARHFSVVEVDSTFYALPKPTVTARWAAQTPEGFVFDVKANRMMTLHDRSLPNIAEKLPVFRAFDELLQPIREKGRLRALLFQFPPWFAKTQSHQHYVEACRLAYEQDMVAVEFRHNSWFQESEKDQTIEWLQALQAIHVVADEPQVGESCIPLVPFVTDARLAILRLHGRNAETWMQPGLTSSGERFRYLYKDKEIEELFNVAKLLHKNAEVVHILMNNNYDNFAIRGAFMMQRLVKPEKPERLTDDTNIWFSEQQAWKFDE